MIRPSISSAITYLYHYLVAGASAWIYNRQKLMQRPPQKPLREVPGTGTCLPLREVPGT